MSEVQPENSSHGNASGEIVVKDSLPIAKALYGAVVGKPSSISKFYNINVTIEKEAVRQLHLKLSQAFERYKVEGTQFSCEISKSDGETITIGTISEFMSFDSSQAETVK